MNTISQTLLSRVPAGAPPKVRETIEIAGRFVDQLREEAAMIRRDPSLTQQGQNEKICEKLASGFGKHFKQVRGDADSAIAAIAAEISGLRKRAIELVSDGYSSELRREVRMYLRTLDPTQRRRLAFEDDRLIRSSILEAPAFLSGLEPQAYDAIEQRVVEGAFGKRLSELEVLHNAWSEADAALKVAAYQMARAAEVDAAAFEKLAA